MLMVFFRVDVSSPRQDSSTDKEQPMFKNKKWYAFHKNFFKKGVSRRQIHFGSDQIFGATSTIEQFAGKSPRETGLILREVTETSSFDPKDSKPQQLSLFPKGKQ